MHDDGAEERAIHGPRARSATGVPAGPRSARDLTRAELHALAVEGKPPAYAATIGEVDEVKREKDQFFGTIARLARDQARAEGVDLQIEVLPGHAAS